MKEEKLATIAVNKAKELLEKMEIGAEISASIVSQEDRIYINIDIKGDDLGLLIGYRGTVLRSLEQIVLLMLLKDIKKDLDKSIRIIIDVNDYRKRKEESIKETTLKAIEQVLESGQKIELPVMPPAERRIVHLTVQKEKGVVSYSEGEDRERRVVIKPEN